MAIGNENGELAEERFDPDAPECVTWSANLSPGRTRIVGDDFAMGEG
jgi:hypothetical protein